MIQQHSRQRMQYNVGDKLQSVSGRDGLAAVLKFIRATKLIERI